MDDETTSRSDLIRALTTAGWFAFVAWLGFVFWVIGRVTRVSAQQFGGVWEQRIEVMSFIALPPNSVMLIPAALLASVAAWMSGPAESLSVAVLLRLVRWAAIGQVVVSAASIVSILVNETGSPTEVQDIGQRVSGVLMSLAVITVSSAVERRSPGGTASQPPALD